MAAVNITISGVICDKYGRTITPCTIVGDATITGLGVGGGPILPPGGGNGDGKPPGIWGGPIDPYPGHPLPEPPGKPPVDPPSIWPGPGDPDYPAGPHPEHPIVLPRPPGGGETPPIQPGTLITWKAVWAPPAVTGGDGSWMVIGVPNVPHPSPS